MRGSLQIPDGAKILEASGKDGSGNVLLLFDQSASPRVLKLYRTRRSRGRELFRTFAQVLLEGKTGSRPRDRCAAEQKNLAAWSGAGCAALHLLEGPIPGEVKDPALWLEYLPRPNLQEVLSNPSTEPVRRQELLVSLGRETCRREQLAERQESIGLVHEHATLNHFFVDGDRLVGFDLENGYREGFPILEALSQEMSTLLRSISRLHGGHPGEDLAAFVEGYEDRDLLRRIVEHGLHARGIRRRLKRWYDRKTRPGKSKTDVLARVHGMI